MESHTRRASSRRRAAGIVVCVLLLTSAVGAGVVAAQEDDGLRFAETVTTEQRGDVADVTLRLGDRRYAALSIRSPDRSYHTRIRIVDADEDGRVTVEINTFRAGWAADPAAAYAVGGDDRLESVDRRTRRLDEPLPEGLYNLIVASGGESTAARLVLGTGAVGEARTGTAPGDWRGGTAGDGGETAPFRTGRVAKGDRAVVDFNVTGVEGLLASSPPAANLVYPTDSTPGRSTTHTVGVDVNRSITPATVTVEYEGATPKRLGGVDADRVQHLGVDADGDGIVDTDLRPAIREVRDTDDGVTLRLDTNATVGAGETLLLAYGATNPDEAGSYEVRAAVADENGTEVGTNGRVVYGPAGRGTLGYGVDLRFTAEGEESVVDPLAALDYYYADDRLYAVVNTSTLSVGKQYGVGLIRWGGASPVGNETATAAGTVRITERHATLVHPTPDTDGGFAVEGGTRTLWMQTTLAPTTEVVVAVSGTTPDSFLFQQTATVGADRTFSARFEMPTVTTRQSITVRILVDGTVVGLEQGVIEPSRDNN